MNKILVITGPTATGKTDLAQNLAKKYHGETVACDSRQVYKGLDVATGKGTDWLYDVVDPKEVYTVKDYIDQAREKIREIWNRENLSIVVGGTGLYLRGLLEGMPQTVVPPNSQLRQQLEKATLEELQKKVTTLSPTFFGSLNNSEKHNPRRLIRHIELLSHNMSSPNVATDEFPADTLKIGLSLPRPVLYQQIDQRINFWFEHGLIDEVKKLMEEGVSYTRLQEIGLEYKLVAQYLKGEMTKEELIQAMQHQTHQYAKRQMTWFQKDPDIHWFDVSAEEWQEQVVKLVDSWYHNNYETQN